jgi:hypothetical protein
MYDIELRATSATLLDTYTYSLACTASLNSKPGDFWLNLGIEPASINGIPQGMHDVQPLVVVNITNNGLDIKGGTSKIELVMPRAALGNTDSSTVFYLLRYDGNYQIQGVSPVDSNNGNVSFNINPSSSSGFYTLVKTLPVATPTPAPSATPVPTPTPTPTPEPSNNMSIYLTLIGTAVGAIVGAALVFFIKK